jgi:uncharacterized lipoprotein YmbA
MKKYFNHLILIAAIAVIAAGCSSAPSKFYTLNSAAVSDGKSQANYAVVVGPVSVPTEVDRPQFTVQVAPNRVEIDEFNRWAEPLNENIARVIAADLSTLLGTPRVAAVSLANFDPTYRVTIDIQKFESEPGHAVQIEAVWVVHKTKGGTTFSGRTDVSEPVKAAGYDELAAAHSRALAKVSSDIAAAIRADAQP